MPRNERKDAVFNRRLIQKALQVASSAVVEEDVKILSKTSVAMSLLSMAASFGRGKEAERLIRIAKRISRV